LYSITDKKNTSFFSFLKPFPIAPLNHSPSNSFLLSLTKKKRDKKIMPAAKRQSTRIQQRQGSGGTTTTKKPTIKKDQKQQPVKSQKQQEKVQTKTPKAPKKVIKKTKKKEVKPPVPQKKKKTTKSPMETEDQEQVAPIVSEPREEEEDHPEPQEEPREEEVTDNATTEVKKERKKYRHKPGFQVKREIKRLQASIKPMCRKLPFARLVKEICQGIDLKADYKWRKGALAIIQHESERVLTEMFQVADGLAHGGVSPIPSEVKQTVYPRHLRTALAASGKPAYQACLTQRGIPIPWKRKDHEQNESALDSVVGQLLSEKRKPPKKRGPPKKISRVKEQPIAATEEEAQEPQSTDTSPQIPVPIPKKKPAKRPPPKRKNPPAAKKQNRADDASTVQQEVPQVQTEEEEEGGGTTRTTTSESQEQANGSAHETPTFSSQKEFEEYNRTTGLEATA